MKITMNFTLEEMYKSNTATRKGINNMPDEKATNNLIDLCYSILQPIRTRWGDPIVVSSGYRCPKLNKAVGGSATSQNKTGEAADIHTLSDNRDWNKRLFDMIVKMVQSGEIVVGQLIDEHNYDWIHISLPNSKHKNEILHL